MNKGNEEEYSKHKQPDIKLVLIAEIKTIIIII